MKVAELKEKLCQAIHRVPIRTADTAGHLSWGKSAEIAEVAIDTLKDAAGTPYQEGETEEITFGSTSWMLTLEEEGS